MNEVDQKLWSVRNLAILAIVLSIAAIIAVIVAIVATNDATRRLNSQQRKLDSLSQEVKHLQRPATPGGGVGPNTGTQTVGNPLPNGSGQ